VRSIRLLCATAALGFLGGVVSAQEPAAGRATSRTQSAAPETSGLKVGPATVAPHWSKNAYPTSIPEGATYYIVERGDTLWDISKRYLANPYLWPQIWDQNKYITDAHWIWPGDPLILPKIALIAGRAGAEGAAGTPEGEAGAEAGEGGAAGAAGAAGVALTPVTEETTLQCADYVVSDGEDKSLVVVGSEQGADKVALAERDIVYLNKGSNSGVKAGEIYSLHHEAYPVRHPESGHRIGTKVETTGWLQVILVHENSAIAVVEQSCADIHAGEYLKPFEKVNVPLVIRRPAANRLTPPTGKLNQYVVDIAGNATIAAEGHMVTIDAGSEAGVAPGNVFSIYRINYPSVPTPRNVIGELTVVAVRDRTATAKVTYSSDAIMIGDQIELR
jgi:LysM domain-containing protein